MTAYEPPALPSGGTKKGQGMRGYIASLTGTSLEWYDFAIYSAASALVFSHVFFSDGDDLSGRLAAFGAYAVGYLARPLGGIVFGRLGDRIGRKKVLVWTLLLIGGATFFIGLIPPHSEIGIVAPIILVFLRLCQGVGVGGEWAGAVLISAEHGDPKRSGFFGSAAQVGPPLGNLMANGALALLALMPNEQFLDWGWRVAFLFSAVLVVVGLLIRVKIEETPVFEALQESGQTPEAPLKELFTTEWRSVVSATMCRICPDVTYALVTVFILTYATREFGLDPGRALLAVVIGSATQLFTIPFAGYLSDRYNRRMVTTVGAVLALIFPFVFFPIMSTGYAGIVLSVVVGLTCHSLMYGPQAALVAEQFSTRLRYVGSSMAYCIGGVFGGAIAPLLFTALLGAYGHWLPLALYVTVVAVITIVGARLARDPAPLPVATPAAV